MARVSFVYEHTDALSHSFKSLAFTSRTERMVEDKRRPDGEILVIDKGYAQDTYIYSGWLNGADYVKLRGWFRGAIVYSAGYPRISIIRYDAVDAIVENLEVYVPIMEGKDRGSSRQFATITFKEKTT